MIGLALRWLRKRQLAAIVIQRVYRGHLARRYVILLRKLRRVEYWRKLPPLEWMLRKQLLKRQGAAFKIKGAVRSLLARRATQRKVMHR